MNPKILLTVSAFTTIIVFFLGVGLAGNFVQISDEAQTNQVLGFVFIAYAGFRGIYIYRKFKQLQDEENL